MSISVNEFSRQVADIYDEDIAHRFIFCFPSRKILISYSVAMKALEEVLSREQSQPLPLFERTNTTDQEIALAIKKFFGRSNAEPLADNQEITEGPPKESKPPS